MNSFELLLLILSALNLVIEQIHLNVFLAVCSVGQSLPKANDQNDL